MHTLGVSLLFAVSTVLMREGGGQLPRGYRTYCFTRTSAEESC